MGLVDPLEVSLACASGIARGHSRGDEHDGCPGCACACHGGSGAELASPDPATPLVGTGDPA